MARLSITMQQRKYVLFEMTGPPCSALAWWCAGLGGCLDRPPCKTTAVDACGADDAASKATGRRSFAL